MKKIIIISIIIIIITGAIIFLISNNNFNDVTVLLYNENKQKINNKKIKIADNSESSINIKIVQKANDINNIGLFYKILTENANQSALSVNIVGDFENTITNGTKEYLIKIKNSSNKEIGIEIGVKISTLSIKYDNNEIQISTEEKEIVNEPNLINGMIPIYYDEYRSSWKKADEYNSNNNWYDYNNQKWANAIMVVPNKRKEYLNSKVSTTIDDSDILAFYVWIPRYRYKLFNVEYKNMDPIEIQVEFENKNAIKQNGNVNGDWITHPSFTFGSDELSGIWVGKYETSVDSEEFNDTKKPKILPNYLSLTGLTPSQQSIVAGYFKTEKYIDDKSKSVDFHVAKNTEWGAIAYLAQSKYGSCDDGICIEIRNNNVKWENEVRFSSITGCAAKRKDSDVVITKEINCKTELSIPYNDLITGVLASTTHNVYGVYDMSGGSWESTMTIMSSSDKLNYLVGQNNNYNSEFSGQLSNGNQFKGNKLLDLKYYDVYNYNADENNNNGSILGDATGETSSWYLDFITFITNDYMWFERGGSYDHQENAGIFSYGGTNGAKNYKKGFRIVAVQTN